MAIVLKAIIEEFTARIPVPPRFYRVVDAFFGTTASPLEVIKLSYPSYQQVLQKLP